MRPGIGKSSLVNELHRALVPSRGLFAAGKFDQYKRDIPYFTLGQSFQSLVRSLLTQSEEELDQWRDALGRALGPNGQLMVNLVPELELVIGKQLPVTDLPPSDGSHQGRFIGSGNQAHRMISSQFSKIGRKKPIDPYLANSRRGLFLFE
jgi:predicted ATPase